MKISVVRTKRKRSLRPTPQQNKNYDPALHTLIDANGQECTACVTFLNFVGFSAK